MRCKIAVALAMFGVVSAGAAQAADDRTREAPSSERRAFVDPETGELRPPKSEELRSLPERRAEGEAAGVKGERRPDGTVLLRMPAERRTRLEATRGADGEVRIRHVPEGTNDAK